MRQACHMIADTVAAARQKPAMGCARALTAWTVPASPSSAAAAKTRYGTQHRALSAGQVCATLCAASSSF